MIDSIVELVSKCPDEFVAGQGLLVDVPAKETVVISAIRDSLRRALASSGRRSFGKVKPCPDHRADGIVVQVADMLAGALQDQAAMEGPYLTPLARRITLV